MHLQDRRTPILGDEQYGSVEWNHRYRHVMSTSLTRPLLHAYSVQFTHPFTHKRVSITAPIPLDMRRLIAKIEREHGALSFGERVMDEKTGLLCGGTDVWEKAHLGESHAAHTHLSLPTGSGGTPVHNVHTHDVERESTRSLVVGGGHVPLDRLRLLDEHWTSVVLPEDEEFLE